MPMYFLEKLSNRQGKASLQNLKQSKKITQMHQYIKEVMSSGYGAKLSDQNFRWEN